MSRPLLLLLVYFLTPAGAAAWEDELTTRLETGFATRAPVRGVEQAREGAFGTVRLAGESFRADAWWHQSFHRGDERVAALGAGYEIWKGSDSASLAIVGTHRRLGDAGNPTGSRPVSHTTELGIRYTAMPFRTVVPSLSYLRDLRREADIVEMSLAREVALTRWGAFLTASVHAGWVGAADVSSGRAGPPVRDGYSYFGADARLPYRIGERTMVVLGAHVSSAHGAGGAWSNLPRASRTHAGLNLSVTFDF